MVKTKRSYCILPNAHSDKWYIYPYDYQWACWIIVSSIDSMYGYSAVYFITDFRLYFIWYLILCFIYVYMYIYKVKLALSLSKIMSTHSTEAFGNCLEIPSKWYALFRFKIGVNFIRTIELWNDENQMETMVYFGMGSNFNSCLTRNSRFLYFLDTENL